MDNQIKKSKLNILDKIKWRVKYRELRKLLGNESSLKRGILKNPIIEKMYEQNKEEIIKTLQRAKSEIPNEISKIDEMVAQTLYQDYMKEKFPDLEEAEDRASLPDLVENINFMMDTKQVNEDVFKHLKLDDCAKKYMKMESIHLLQYSRETLNRIPFDTLKRLSFIPETELKGLDGLTIDSIVEQQAKGVDNSNILKYIEISKESDLNVPDFLRENMEYTNLFEKYREEYSDYPTDILYDFFEDTKNMEAKEQMLKLGIDKEVAKDLRSKYYDHQIEKYLRSGYGIDYAKDLIEKKYFNISYSDINKILENDDTGKFSQQTQKIMSYINKINSIDDISTLIRLNNQMGQIDLKLDIGKSFDEIYEYYVSDKVKGTLNPEKLEGEKNFVEYKGKKVEIIKLKGEDFKANVHALGYREAGGKNLGMREERESKLYDDPLKFAMLQGGSSQLSLSVIRDDKMGLFSYGNDALLLGFSNIEPENVLGYSKGDGATNIGQANYSRVIGDVKDNIALDEPGYDELCVTRYENANKLESQRNNGEKRILPNYILVFSGNIDMPHINYDNLDDPNTKRILEYATTYNIPIVEIDSEKYREKMNINYNELYSKVIDGNEEVKEGDLKALFRYKRSVDFYSYGKPNIEKNQKIFLDILNKINLTDKNSPAIRSLIDQFDKQDKNWVVRNFSSQDIGEQQTLQDKIQGLRDSMKENNLDAKKEGYDK